ncbi:MAG: hypothetical protein AAGA76_10655 [Pseudomonadota bacterium]
MARWRDGEMLKDVLLHTAKDFAHAIMTLEKQDDRVAFPDKIGTGAGPVTAFDPMCETRWQVL